MSERITAVFKTHNQQLIRPDKVRQILGVEHRQTLEKCYPYLPYLAIHASAYPLRRFPATYISELSQPYNAADQRHKSAAMRAFSLHEENHALTSVVKTDVAERIGQASRGGLVMTRDIARIFNIGESIVSQWCREREAFEPVRQGVNVFIPEDAVRQSYAWHEPETICQPE